MAYNCLNDKKLFIGKFLGSYFDKKYTSIISRDEFNEYKKYTLLFEKLSGIQDVNLIYKNKNTFREKDISKKLDINENS